MRSLTRAALLGLAGVTLAACNGFGFGGADTMTPPTPERVAMFENMLQAGGCQLPHTDNDAMLAAGGFSDGEASAISQQLIAERRASVAPNGNLVLHTGACL